jgi:predicted hydrolase (HD superfamily)
VIAEPTRDNAWALVCEWIESESLRKHVLGVEAAMRAYARRDTEDEEKWAVTGLVHDLDYERYPDPDTGHPRYALKELEARGYPPDVVEAVATPSTSAFPAKPTWRRRSTRWTSSRDSSPRARSSAPPASMA